MNVERDKAHVFNPSVHPLRSPHNLLPLPSNVRGRITFYPLLYLMVSLKNIRS